MTESTHHVTPIDLTAAGPSEGASPEEVLEHTIAVTVLGITGVHKLGTAPARLAGALRGAIGSGTVPGVRAGTTDDGLVVDVSVVAEYPTNVSELADTIRTQIQHAVGQLDDEPVAIDVTVTDIHGPFDSDEDAADRVDAASAAVNDAAGKAKAAVGDAAGKAKAAAGDAADKARVAAGDVAADARDGASAAAAQLSDKADELAGKAGEVADEATSSAADLGDAVSEKAGDVADRARAVADDAKATAADAVDSVADAGDEARRTADADTSDDVRSTDDTTRIDASGDADVVVTVADGTVTVEVDGDDRPSDDDSTAR